VRLVEILAARKLCLIWQHHVEGLISYSLTVYGHDQEDLMTELTATQHLAFVRTAIDPAPLLATLLAY
jgi:hypothetical protein